MVLWESDGKYSVFDEIWQARHFWEQTGPAKKKGSANIRTCRIHRLHLISGKGFWFYGNLTGNIRDLTRFGKPDIFGNKLVQRRKKDRKLPEPVKLHQSHLISGTVALADITEQTRVYHYNGEQQTITNLNTARQVTTLT